MAGKEKETPSAEQEALSGDAARQAELDRQQAMEDAVADHNQAELKKLAPEA